MIEVRYEGFGSGKLGRIAEYIKSYMRENNGEAPKFFWFVWNSHFADALRITQDKLDSKNFYAYNPAFDGAGVFRKRK